MSVEHSFRLCARPALRQILLAKSSAANVERGWNRCALLAELRILQETNFAANVERRLLRR